jgi:hypothetical protein
MRAVLLDIMLIIGTQLGLRCVRPKNSTLGYIHLGR